MSLARLLDAQPGIVCFHEINPSAMAWEGAERTVISLLRDFRAMLAGEERGLTIDRTSPHRDAPVERMMALEEIHGFGDVAHYYLPYVETILAREPEARFPCLWRDRDQVVESFIAKLKLKPHGRMERLRATLKGEHLPESRNHWAGPSDTRWRGDPRFDDCFPSYEGLETAPLVDHLRRWHEYYYTRVRELMAQYPDNIRIFEIDALNDATGRKGILEFALPEAEIDADVLVHANHRSVTL